MTEVAPLADISALRLKRGRAYKDRKNTRQIISSFFLGLRAYSIFQRQNLHAELSCIQLKASRSEKS